MVLDASSYCDDVVDLHWTALEVVEQVLSELTAEGAAERRVRVREEMTRVVLGELEYWRNEDARKLSHSRFASDHIIADMLDFLALTDVPHDFIAAYETARSRHPSRPPLTADMGEPFFPEDEGLPFFTDSEVERTKSLGGGGGLEHASDLIHTTSGAIGGSSSSTSTPSTAASVPALSIP